MLTNPSVHYYTLYGLFRDYKTSHNLREPSFEALLLTAQLTQQRNANVLRIMILFSTSQVFRKYHNKGGFYRPGRVKVSLHVAVSQYLINNLSHNIYQDSELIKIGGTEKGHSDTLCQVVA